MESLTTTPEIAFTELRLGDATLQGGDLFEARRFLREGVLTERHVDMLRSQAKVKPLTRENYAIWIARNQPGWIGRGFTEAYLKELGIIDADTAAQANAAAAEAKKKAAAEKPRLERVLSGDPMEYRGFLIQAFKYGRFTNFDAFNADLELLRTKPFKSLEYAKKFIDDLVESTEKAGGSTTGEQSQESTHDRDVQSGA